MIQLMVVGYTIIFSLLSRYMNTFALCMTFFQCMNCYSLAMHDFFSRCMCFLFQFITFSCYAWIFAMHENNSQCMNIISQCLNIFSMHEYQLMMHDVPRCMSISHDAWFYVIHEYLSTMHNFSLRHEYHIFPRCLVFCEVSFSLGHEYLFTMPDFHMGINIFPQCINHHNGCVSSQ